MKTITGPYQYRVNYAAACLVRGAVYSRSFDNCFEMGDSDLVVTALVRRAAKNPRLYKAIADRWRGQFPQSWIDTATRYLGVATRDLPKEAARARGLLA